MATLRTELAIAEERAPTHAVASADKVIAKLRALPETWAMATSDGRAELLNAFYERIVVVGPEFISARLTPDAYAMGLALALPNHRSGTKHLHHPLVGDLTLGYELMELPADPGLTLVTYSADPGPPSEAGLRELAGWSATRDKLNAVEATSEATLFATSGSLRRPGMPVRPRRCGSQRCVSRCLGRDRGAQRMRSEI